MVRTLVRFHWRILSIVVIICHYLFTLYHYISSNASTSSELNVKIHEAELMRYATLGVITYDVSLENQTANIVAAKDLDYETVLKTIKKTGKKVNTGEQDGKPMSVDE